MEKYNRKSRAWEAKTCKVDAIDVRIFREVVMKRLEGFQKKYLRGLAHSMNPVVIIGQKGYSDTVISAIDSALTTHELIKIKFIDFKDKSQKNELLESIVKNSKCEDVGMIGHTAILYRENHEPENRKITLPKRKK